jgi:hypothetical protein
VFSSVYFLLNGIFFIVLDRVFLDPLSHNLASILPVDIERRLYYVLSGQHFTRHSKLRRIRSCSLTKVPLLSKSIACAVFSSNETSSRILATYQLPWDQPTVSTFISLLEVLSRAKLKARSVLIDRLLFGSISLFISSFEVIVSEPQGSRFEI